MLRKPLMQKKNNLSTLACPRDDMFFVDSATMDAKRLDILSNMKLEIQTTTMYCMRLRTERVPRQQYVRHRFPCVETELGSKVWGPVENLVSRPLLFRNDSNIPDYVINVSSHDDMQEVLLVADVLVTDYSSSVWDFGLLERPCFPLYA